MNLNLKSQYSATNLNSKSQNSATNLNLNTNLNASMTSLTSDNQVMSCVLISGSTISEGGL